MRTDPPELTVRAALLGAALAVVFGAANAYLALRVGLTVSASIPAAVMAVAVFRAVRRAGSGSTLLESNMVQTIGSAGESLAAGVVFTAPALLLFGEPMPMLAVLPAALIGGTLGTVLMVPLRRRLVVEEAATLPYPEGTVCAEVQRTAEAGGPGATELFAGLAGGALFALAERTLRLWPSSTELALRYGRYRTTLGAEVSPELVAIGWILGPRVANVMLAGGVLGWLVLIPLFALFGDGLTTPLAPEALKRVAELGPDELWSRYLRYVGAGAVAAAGLVALLRAVPSIVAALRSLSGALRAGVAVERTDRDLAPPVLLGTTGVCAVLLVVWPLRADGAALGLVPGLVAAVVAFFFVTVSAKIVGLVGSSSNPISGMTIATLLACSVAVAGGQSGRLSLLAMATVVCIAAAIAGDTSQDLKTGQLVGATPYKQQIGQLIGVAASACALVPLLGVLANGVTSGALKAPQANLVKLVVEGVLGGTLPWELVLVGMALTLVAELLGLPALAFAVGLYLPLSLAVPVALGAGARVLADAIRTRRGGAPEGEHGVLLASGLVAGAALVGVFGAAATFAQLPLSPLNAPPASALLPAVLALAALLVPLVVVGARVPRANGAVSASPDDAS